MNENNRVLWMVLAVLIVIIITLVLLMSLTTWQADAAGFDPTPTTVPECLEPGIECEDHYLPIIMVPGA